MIGRSGFFPVPTVEQAAQRGEQIAYEDGATYDDILAGHYTARWVPYTGPNSGGYWVVTPSINGRKITVVGGE